VVNNEVVVVGAGPTGLMQACELSLSGVRPLVLEQRPEPSELPKANGIAGMIVKLFDYRGLLDRIRQDSSYVGPLPSFPFGSAPLDFSALGASGLPGALIPQPRLERLLDSRAQELGVEIRRGHELIGLTQDDDGVTIDVRGPEGTYQLRSRYLVGCDGARSPVRHHAEIGFPGTTAGEVTRLGHVTMPGSVTVLPTGELEVPGVGRLRPGTHRTDRGAYSIASFTPGVLIVAATEETDQSDMNVDTDMTLNELRLSLGRVLGIDFPLGDPIWLSRIVGQSRLADRYRAGRVFLAGDAAHLFAAGGAALNVGLLDTVNLGWKLAAELRGWAPPRLLDTYHTERYAAGARTMLQTRAQSALATSGEDGAALRELWAELLTYEQPLRHVAELLSGADLCYDMSGDDDHHPLVGRFAPDLSLKTPAGTTRVAELMHTGRPVLLDLADQAAPRDIAAGFTDRVDVVTAGCDQTAAAALLIRPDGYVAWAVAPEADHRQWEGLRGALSTWFGSPA